LRAYFLDNKVKYATEVFYLKNTHYFLFNLLTKQDERNTYFRFQYFLIYISEFTHVIFVIEPFKSKIEALVKKYKKEFHNLSKKTLTKAILEGFEQAEKLK
jgi:hypothetical protein